MPIIDPNVPPGHDAGIRPLERKAWPAIARGLRLRCPACGEGALLQGYLTPIPTCGHCGEPFGHFRTDDVAPWVTIVVVGHFVVPFVLWSERAFSPPLWVSMTLWPLVAAVGMALFLPRAKGAILGLMWSQRLTGEESQ